MEEVNKTVKLKNVTLIGNFDYIFTEVLPELKDCYLISKECIVNIEGKFQGAKVITTKPIF